MTWMRGDPLPMHHPHAVPHLDARGWCRCSAICCIDQTDGKCKCRVCACEQIGKCEADEGCPRCRAVWGTA